MTREKGTGEQHGSSCEGSARLFAQGSAQQLLTPGQVCVCPVPVSKHRGHRLARLPVPAHTGRCAQLDGTVHVLQRRSTLQRDLLSSLQRAEKPRNLIPHSSPTRIIPSYFHGKACHLLYLLPAISWNAGISRCSLLPVPKLTDTSALLTKGMRRKK